jgi:hypothetical protein
LFLHSNIKRVDTNPALQICLLTNFLESALLFFLIHSINWELLPMFKSASSNLNIAIVPGNKLLPEKQNSGDCLQAQDSDPQTRGNNLQRSLLKHSTERFIQALQCQTLWGWYFLIHLLPFVTNMFSPPLHASADYLWVSLSISTVPPTAKKKKKNPAVLLYQELWIKIKSQLLAADHWSSIDRRWLGISTLLFIRNATDLKTWHIN